MVKMFLLKRVKMFLRIRVSDFERKKENWKSIYVYQDVRKK